ncbi:transglycosylase domain-containing protein [Ectobacillus polymachus]|uniref:transglycosylase domain-containing protein n=1 Tax=Ectobacillus polymachus TaxID=1508806 RepID=UPI003A86F0EF
MKKGLILAGSVAIVCVVALVGYLCIIFLGNFVIDDKKLVFQSTSRIVDEQGNEITKMYDENRELVSIDEIPQYVQHAFVAAEDTRFYEHHGVDFTSIFRALYRDILAGSKVEGGSTITQQLAKNIFLTNEKTWLRKTQELIIAVNLEQRYTKPQLLEMYANQVYFGHGVYGIETASQFYFHKHVKDLTVSEGALLAGLMKAPTTYSPIMHPNKSKERRDLVLSLMNKQGFLNAEETVRQQGKTLGLDVLSDKEEQAFLPFIDMVFQEAADTYKLSYEEVLRGGYTFVVTLDPTIQKNAYNLFQDNRNFPEGSNDIEGSFVLMDSKTGGIKAAIGGRHYVLRGYNRLYMKRQPGSVMKPILVYAPALETKKYQPYSMLSNEKQSFDGYIPRNYHDIYSKEITMFDAIKDSANVPAVSLLNEIGIDAAKSYLKKANVNISDSGLSAALGGLKEGVSPLDLVKVYRSFSADGNVVEPHVIERIINQKGAILGQASQKETNIFSKQTAWYMTRMLEGTVKDGTAQSGTYNGALAGKTGTTSLPNRDKGARDTWFVGYTPRLVGAVWMGYDRTDESHYVTAGSDFPTKLFKKILTSSHVETDTAFAMPDGVENIGEPIRLAKVTNVHAKLTFTPFGLFTVKLTWNPLSDSRVQYRIYKKEGDSSTLLTTVTGQGEYEMEYVNVFAVPSLYIVPFNPQTNREGEKTECVKS